MSKCGFAAKCFCGEEADEMEIIISAVCNRGNLSISQHQVEKISVWDTAEDIVYDRLLVMYVPMAHIIIYLINLCDARGLEGCQDKISCCRGAACPDTVSFIVGNRPRNQAQVIPAEQAAAFARQLFIAQ